MCPDVRVSGGGTEITSGTLADRPAAGNADVYYWATDVYILYRDTGAAWEIVAENIETASYVVWSDGTTWYAKNGTTGQIDFNSANPATVINNALATANVNKVTLLMHANWTTTTTISIPAGVHLCSVGWGYTINYNGDDNCIEMAGDNVIVSDLKVTIEAGAGSAGHRPNCIYAANRTNLNVRQCWLVGDDTVGDDGSPFRQCGISFSTVTYSRISVCKTNGHVQCGLAFSTLSYSNIVGNNCDDNSVGLYTDDCLYDTITGNTCCYNGSGGIYLENSVHMTITGNNCSKNDNGILNYNSSSDYNTITGNICNSNSEEGIYVINGSDCTVTGNNCHINGKSGIRISWASSHTVVGNTCHDNSDHGIFLDNADDNTVVGNNCEDNSKWGIFLDTADKNQIATNKTVNNGLGSITVSNVACTANTLAFNNVEEGAPVDAGTTTRSYGNYDPSANAFVGDVGASPW